MQIKTKKSFNDLIKSLTKEIVEEEDLEEISTTAGGDIYRDIWLKRNAWK
mgnify:CR=1 FL=1